MDQLSDTCFIYFVIAAEIKLRFYFGIAMASVLLLAVREGRFKWPSNQSEQLNWLLFGLSLETVYIYELLNSLTVM